MKKLPTGNNSPAGEKAADRQQHAGWRKSCRPAKELPTGEQAAKHPETFG
jgi:hypothetical protein